MKSLKVLVIAKAYPPIAGGVESYSESVARAYLALGYDVTVLTQTTGPSGWQERFHQEGSIHVFNIGPGGQALAFLKFLRSLRALTGGNSYAFIHATTWRVGLAAQLCRRRGSLLALSVHGREVLINPWYLRVFMKHVFTHVDGLVVVSEATRMALRSALGEAVSARAQIAFNGITYPDQCRGISNRPANSETIRILSFARLVERKNIQGCIAALGQINRQGITSFHYTVCGSGPLLEVLRDQARREGILEKVSFLGYVDEGSVPSHYLNADIFLHPQISLEGGRDIEGFGIVIADAMAFGLAVIAGDSGGPKDFVTDGVTGLLVNGKDISAIADAIALLVKDHEMRNRLGRQAQEFALSNLSWERHATVVIEALGAQCPMNLATAP